MDKVRFRQKPQTAFCPLWSDFLYEPPPPLFSKRHFLFLSSSTSRSLPYFSILLDFLCFPPISPFSFLSSLPFLSCPFISSSLSLSIIPTVFPTFFSSIVSFLLVSFRFLPFFLSFPYLLSFLCIFFPTTLFPYVLPHPPSTLPQHWFRCCINIFIFLLSHYVTHLHFLFLDLFFHNLAASSFIYPCFLSSVPFLSSSPS